MTALGIDEESGLTLGEGHTKIVIADTSRPRTIPITTTQITIRTSFLFCMVFMVAVRGNGRHMAGVKSWLTRRVWGGSDARAVGLDRTLRGLREGDRRELYFGLALSALAYLRRSKPRKELLYRQAVPEGTALVIHHRKSGTARLEIIKPGKKRRR